jgi:hypothetical protein
MRRKAMKVVSCTPGLAVLMTTCFLPAGVDHADMGIGK